MMLVLDNLQANAEVKILHTAQNTNLKHLMKNIIIKGGGVGGYILLCLSVLFQMMTFLGKVLNFQADKSKSCSNLAVV